MDSQVSAHRAVLAKLDMDHERAMAALHQRWMVRSAWLFAIAGVAACALWHGWLLVSAAWFALQVYESRKARNRALDLVHRMERIADGRPQ